MHLTHYKGKALVIILNTEIRSKKALVSCIFFFLAFVMSIGFFAIIFLKDGFISEDSSKGEWNLLFYNLFNSLSYLMPIIASLILLAYSILLYSNNKKINLLRISVIILFLSRIVPIIINIYSINSGKRILTYWLQSMISLYIIVPLVTFVLLFVASLKIFIDPKIISIAILITIVLNVLSSANTLLRLYSFNKNHNFSLLSVIYYILFPLSITFLYLGLFYITQDTFPKVKDTTVPQDSLSLIKESLASLKKEFEDGTLTEEQYTEKRIDVLKSLE